MQVGRATGLAILVAVVAFAPAWAQDSQQTPPPSVPPMATGPNAGNRRDAGGPQVNTRRRVGPPGERRMVWRRDRGARGFRERGEFRGPRRGLAVGLARIVNNADLRQQLGITDAQAGKIRQLSSAFQVSQIRSRADIQVDRLQLRDLLTAQSPNRTAIDQKLNQVSAAQLALRKQQVHYMLDLRDVLTAEQRQKLQQMRQDRARRGRRVQGLPPAPPANR